MSFLSLFFVSRARVQSLVGAACLNERKTRFSITFMLNISLFQTQTHNISGVGGGGEGGAFVGEGGCRIPSHR